MRASAGKTVFVWNIQKENAGRKTHLKLWNFAAAAAVLAERGYTVKAARMGDEKYFVCAYGSEEVYRICKKYFPGKVRENMQPVIERADKKDKQMVMELLMEAGLCGEMGSGRFSFLDNLKRRWEA